MTKSDPDLDCTTSAVFSGETPPLHRYLLRRDIDMLGGRVLVSCGYNPSDAGHAVNDPTITREIGFCKTWQCSTLLKCNVFAGIDSDPDNLAAMADPVGPLADEAIRSAAAFCKAHNGIMLACWGAPKGKAKTKRLFLERLAVVATFGIEWHALRITASGYPEHPLYLPGHLRPERWHG